MKKHLLRLWSPVIGLVLLASFIPLKTKAPSKGLSPRPVPIACEPGSPVSFLAYAFTPTNLPYAPMVRHNIYSLTAAQITSLKNGIAAMKQLPYSDKTSWEYQAAIHGTLRTNNLPSWNSCQHGTPFFLSWHRMYLYYFERILRAKSGDASLTLPYWDYQSNPVLPPAYRDATPGNPLYDSTRYASINGGGSLPNSIMVDFANILSGSADIPYYTFSSDLESPHGSVHTSIGGNMFYINRSALDPCFWLHHTNIDRLWQVWLRNCGGRSDPSDNTYLNQQFTFFDENGTAVTMTGSQVINTAASLNYVYDFPRKLPCNFPIYWKNWKWLRVPIIIWPPIPIELNAKTSLVTAEKAQTEPLNSFVKTLPANSFRFSEKDISDQVILEVESLSVEKLPEGAIEVYVNLAANEVPVATSKSFAGVLNLFNASAGNHMGHSVVTTVNLSSAVQKLGLKPADLSKMRLTFYTRGNTLKGKEINTSGNVKIGKLTLVIQKAQG